VFLNLLWARQILHVADKLERDMVGLNETQRAVESAGRIVFAGSDELYEGGVFGDGDALRFLDQESTDSPAAGLLGDDEHGHFDDDIAMGEVWFDPKACCSNDTVLVLGYKNPCSRLF
jgi:hypothetical protein